MSLSCGKSFFSSCRESNGSSLGFPKRRCRVPTVELNWRSPLVIRNEMGKAATTFSCKTITDLPLHESPMASFDHYLENKARVFRAVLPDKERSEQLSEDQWRVYMSSVRFLHISSQPVVDMRIRCKSGGIGYPPQVPRDVRNIILIDIVRWELQQSGVIIKPSEFTICGNGVLYPDRSKSRSRLKGFSSMSVSCVLPPVLQLVPHDILKDASESMLKGLVQSMTHQVNGGLLADYDQFKKEKLSKFVT